MLENILSLNNIREANNSLFLRHNNQFVLYEKISNTLHIGTEREILKIQELVESMSYNPLFECETLRGESNAKFESLLLNVTESCNLNCGYCIYSGDYEGERVNTPVHMNFDVAKKAIDLFVPYAREPNPLIGFYGGEPLNNMDLIKKVIDYSKKTYPKSKFVFSLTTNFVNAERYLKYIVDEQIYANVSLDGPKKVHDKYRLTKDGKPTFERIMHNLELLGTLSPGYVGTHIGLNGTYQDSEDFPLIVDYFIEQDKNFSSVRIGGREEKGRKDGIKNHLILPFISSYAEMYTKNILSNKAPPKVLKRMFDDVLGTIFKRSDKKLPELLMLMGACYPGQRKIFVDTDGLIYMCEKFGKRLSIGDVNSGLNQIHIDKAINDFFNIRNNYCTDNCWAERLCSPCIHSAKEPKGEVSVNGLAQICNPSKTQVIIGIMLYLSIIKENNNILNRYFNQ